MKKKKHLPCRDPCDGGLGAHGGDRSGRQLSDWNNLHLARSWRGGRREERKERQAYPYYF